IGPPGSQGVGFLLSGFTETSNVQMVEEMVEMISAQRAYESNSRVVKAADEMLRTAAQIK
ncbi:MAG: flagellar basal body rod C-terminal domain-containing protein, partial [Myxococcota bacterium]|nr:flagellar basal body rod C-terminal domain-containing protein [Myxococcota bacterium]